MKIKVIDLFSGCGGMTLGFQNAGFEIVAAFDNWKPAIKVYKKNFAHSIFSVDLSNLTESLEILERFDANMIIGGPPCQDFSHAGKRDEELGRADLTISFAKIISQKKPRWFVMENVDRTVKSERYRLACDILKNAGYGLTQTILDASFCGVPQKRKRLFLIGELNGFDQALENYLKMNLSPTPLTVKGYLDNSLGIEHYYRHPRNYSRRAIFSIDEPSPTIRGVNRPIPKTYKEHPNDTAPISKNVRPLTTIERSYIQTFPENFVFKGAKTDLEQMIGNAVPVKQAEHVAKSVKAFIWDQEKQSSKGQSIPVQLPLFRYS
jgi:DNA (cytosine-5)-methyltransferase 1